MSRAGRRLSARRAAAAPRRPARRPASSPSRRPASGPSRRPPLRPRRVLLFCPASEEARIAKAAGLGADGVILDLEDGVALGLKAKAREAATRALARLDFGRSERIVRINPPRTADGAADLAALAACAVPPDAVVIPKVGSAEEIRIVARRLAGRRGRTRRGPPALIALVETARGVVSLASIAAAGPPLEALAFGAEDLIGDIGGVRTRQGNEVLYARSAVALHAAAAGLQAVDSPCIDLADATRLIDETREALALGYSGKMAIHPRQIAPIAAAFTPSSGEVEAAERLLREHQRHAALGSGVFVLDGKMVDMPMVRAAEAVLARARAAGVIA